MTLYLKAPQTKMLVKCVDKIRETTGHNSFDAYRNLLDLLAWHFKFVDAETPKLDDRVVKEVLKIFDFDLLRKDGIHDYYGATFEALDLSSKWHGQFFTPENVSDFMAQMIINKEEKMPVPMTVMDPACGSGRLLLSAFKVLKYGYGRDMRTTTVVYFGVDIDVLVYRIALLNQYTYQLPAMLLCADSLNADVATFSPNWLKYGGLWNPPYPDLMKKWSPEQKEAKEQIQAVKKQAEEIGQASLFDFKGAAR